MHTPDFDRAIYTRHKTVTARWPSGIRAGAQYLMPTMR
jgi:malonate-semialdehyde dehydrogenase (acetylating)/methylmalonate-semialdehyde dehydrogenase